MPDEDDGILGNLPRARPGTRSDKRSRPDTDEAGRSQAATPRKPRQASKSRATARKPQSAPEPAAPPDDGVGEVVRAAEALARTSLRVGAGLAGGALRRLTGR